MQGGQQTQGAKADGAQMVPHSRSRRRCSKTNQCESKHRQPLQKTHKHAHCTSSQLLNAPDGWYREQYVPSMTEMNAMVAKTGKPALHQPILFVAAFWNVSGVAVGDGTAGRASA